jgi:ATP/maltotriose-dependent transcriptional regulator MalT
MTAAGMFVKSHTMNIFVKLGCRARYQVVSRADPLGCL